VYVGEDSASVPLTEPGVTHGAAYYMGFARMGSLRTVEEAQAVAERLLERLRPLPPFAEGDIVEIHADGAARGRYTVTDQAVTADGHGWRLTARRLST
jgi:hypothetical protein